MTGTASAATATMAATATVTSGFGLENTVSIPLWVLIGLALLALFAVATFKKRKTDTSKEEKSDA